MSDGMFTQMVGMQQDVLRTAGAMKEETETRAKEE